MALYDITKERFDKVIDLYFMWKKLNSMIKEDYSRGINLPEAITEPICCYANNFQLSIPTTEEARRKKKADKDEQSGSEDAINPDTGALIQIKATSNWDSDLTSFGPKSHFDELHFVRLNQEEDKMYLYNIPIDNLKSVKVNKTTTFEECQASGKRPRFSIIDKYINIYDLHPYGYVDLSEKEVYTYKKEVITV